MAHLDFRIGVISYVVMRLAYVAQWGRVFRAGGPVWRPIAARRALRPGSGAAQVTWAYGHYFLFAAIAAALLAPAVTVAGSVLLIGLMLVCMVVYGVLIEHRMHVVASVEETASPRP